MIKRHARIGLASASLLLLVALTSCGGGETVNGSSSSGSDTRSVQYPIQIVATVGMVADIVRQVGGGHVDVAQICGSGVDPHLYKATRDDVQAIMSADMVFYSGLMLEGKMSDTLVKVAQSKPVIAVTEKIPEDQLLEPEDFAGHYDPHVWMDVMAWSQCVMATSAALREYDPDHAADYQRNAENYVARLLELHEYGLKSIATIPESSRVLITSHDAFNYFGRAYGLNVQGVQGLSTESEAGLQRINELVDLLVDQKIGAVFVESSVSRKNIEALVDGAKSRGHQIIIGGELFSDAMGSEGTYEGTYIGMLDHNMTLVARALGGQVPHRGLNDKLADTTH